MAWYECNKKRSILSKAFDVNYNILLAARVEANCKELHVQIVFHINMQITSSDSMRRIENYTFPKTNPISIRIPFPIFLFFHFILFHGTYERISTPLHQHLHTFYDRTTCKWFRAIGQANIEIKHPPSIYT